MSKNFLIIVLVISYFSYSFSQPKDTIYGKFKTVREQLKFLDPNHQNLTFLSMDGDYGHSNFVRPEWTIERFRSLWYNSPFVHYINYYKEYNEKGLPTEETWFYKDGDIVKSYQYKYDKKDNLIQNKEIYKPEDFIIRNFTYNYKNNISSSIYYSTENPNNYSYREHVYDSIDNLSEEKYFDEYGYQSSYKFEYDSEKRIIIEKFHTPYLFFEEDGATLSRKDQIGLDKISKKYSYNSDGKIIEIQKYSIGDYDNLPSKLFSKITNSYRNDLLTTVTRSFDTINNKKEFYYDDYNRKVKEEMTYFFDMDSNLSVEYFYDALGNIIKLIYTEKDKMTVVDFEYTFDDHNNWKKQIKSLNGKKLFVWTRKIKYYK